MVKLLDIYIRKTTRIVVGVSTQKKSHDYINRADGLVIAPGGPQLPGGQRLAVPRHCFDDPRMTPLLERDGLTDIKDTRVGARVAIRERPGIFVGLVNTWPKVTERPLINIGGVVEVTVDGQPRSRKRTTYPRELL